MTGFLRTAWSRWLLLCGEAGDLVLLCVLTVFYFVLFFVPSLYYTWCTDTVGKRCHNGTYFEDMQGGDETLGDAGEMA